jgi:lipoprotein-releasing system ATP-binding protein
VIGGLDTPDEGLVTIDGHSLKNISDEELSSFRNQKMGFIFQVYNLLQDFTVLENVMLPHYILTRNKKKAIVKAKEILARLGLSHRETYYPSRLSGGEQQRAAVARALINDPAFILADEPTGNLDKENRERVIHLLLELKKEFGFTLIIVTHDFEIARMSNRAIRLNYGIIENFS